VSSAGVSAARVARNSGLLIAADLAGKLATVALFAIMARELGRRGFGDFTYAAALAALVTSLAGLGTDDIVSRAVAQRERDARGLVRDALTIKLVVGGAALLAVAVLAIVGQFSSSMRATLILVSASALVDLLAQTVYAVFRGLGDLAPESACRTVQIWSRAAGGVAALLMGGGTASVAAVYVVTSALALALGAALLRRRFALQRGRREVTAMKRLAVASLPLAVTALIDAVVFSVDTLILAAQKGNAAVGLFGAASRLVDSTFFVAAAVGAAVVPALAGAARRTVAEAAAVYEGTCKALAAVLLPVSVAFVLFARPLTTIVFGDRFEPAASAVRLLGPTVLLFAVSSVSIYLLIAFHRQALVPLMAGAALLVNVVFALLLIPTHSFNGAAIAVLVAEVGHVAVVVIVVRRLVRRLSLRRILLGPSAGTLGMGLVALLAGDELLVLGLAAFAYLLILLTVERVAYPADLRLTLGLLRRSAYGGAAS
jgi:O-antigen/teichoic acid export membrane protein